MANEDEEVGVIIYEEDNETVVKWHDSLREDEVIRMLEYALEVMKGIKDAEAINREAH